MGVYTNSYTYNLERGERGNKTRSRRRGKTRVSASPYILQPRPTIWLSERRPRHPTTVGLFMSGACSFTRIIFIDHERKRKKRCIELLTLQEENTVV
ncbi:hypothetical protein BDZ89DRAFT_1078974, partial [Hymenopellis radicata]